MIPLLVLQALIGLGPFTAEWDYASDSPATFVIYVDGTAAAQIPIGVHMASFTLPTFGQHVIAVTAKQNNLESDPNKAKINFTNASAVITPPSSPPVITDPSCTPPLGQHAPAVFIVSSTITTGKPGSPSYLTFKLGGSDPVVELAVQIDGADAVMLGPAGDLRATGSAWFTQPAPGTHTLGVRVLNAHGCPLTKIGPPFIVKP